VQLVSEPSLNLGIKGSEFAAHHDIRNPLMKRKHYKTLAAIFAHPASWKIRWRDIEVLLEFLGAEVQERKDHLLR